MVHDIAIWGQLLVLDVLGIVGERRRDHLSRCVGEYRRAGADEPVMVQKGPAERSLEEAVGHGVLTAELVERQSLQVPVTHWESPGVGPVDEAVHLSAVDLVLLAV